MRGVVERGKCQTNLEKQQCCKNVLSFFERNTNSLPNRKMLEIQEFSELDDTIVQDYLIERMGLCYELMMMKLKMKKRKE